MKFPDSETASTVIIILEVIAIIFVLALLLLENSPSLTRWLSCGTM